MSVKLDCMYLCTSVFLLEQVHTCQMVCHNKRLLVNMLGYTETSTHMASHKNTQIDSRC